MNTVLNLFRQKNRGEVRNKKKVQVTEVKKFHVQM